MKAFYSELDFSDKEYTVIKGVRKLTVSSFRKDFAMDNNSDEDWIARARSEKKVFLQQKRTGIKQILAALILGTCSLVRLHYYLPNKPLDETSFNFVKVIFLPLGFLAFLGLANYVIGWVDSENADEEIELASADDPIKYVNDKYK